MAEYYMSSAVEEGIGDEQGYGAIYKVTFESDKVIYVTLGDKKGDDACEESFKKENEYYYSGSGEQANTLEFICNYNNKNPNEKFYSENMTTTHGTDRNRGKAITITNGEQITSIELLVGTEINWEEYFE